MNKMGGLAEGAGVGVRSTGGIYLTEEKRLKLLELLKEMDKKIEKIENNDLKHIDASLDSLKLYILDRLSDEEKKKFLTKIVQLENQRKTVIKS